MTAASYVPIDRRWAIARGEPLADRTRGAALFADISGFSTMASKLVETLGGKRGSEALLEAVGPVFDALIGEVHRHRGSVVSFAGDGVVCWFEGDPGERAVTAALAMQGALARGAEGEASAPSIKVGIAAGPARRFLVGDPKHLVIDVLAGATVERMSAAALVAKRGEIVLSPEVARALGSRLVLRGEAHAVVDDLRERAAPAPWGEPDAARVAPELLEAFRPSAVHDRIAAGAELAADLRVAAPVFVQFSGIDYDGDDRAGDALDAYVRWAQAVFARYEGMLLQLTVGDKGSCLYGVFGVPMVHQDDARRALAAATELASPPPELAAMRAPRIGIAHGKAWAGVYGGASRRSFSVMGSEVNVAARLMELAARGQTLASKRVADPTAQTHVWSARGAVVVKGSEAPVPIAELVGVREGIAPATSERRAAIVGRAAELARIDAAIDDVARGGARCVVLEAGAGLGKSTLVSALVSHAAARGLRALVGGGDSIDRGTPYRAWRPIFARLFDLEGDEPPEIVLPRVLSRLDAIDRELRARAPLLAAVLPLRLPDTELTALMTGEVRGDNTRELLARLVRDLGSDGPPVALVLDDAHWMDAASHALARRVAQGDARALLVVATRPLAEEGIEGPARGEHEKLRELATTERLVLGALDKTAAVEVARRRLGARAVDPALADFVHTRAAGHPYFTEELASALRESGLVEIAGGTARLAARASAATELEFPDTIERAITARLDRLQPLALQIAKVASVVGPTFPYDALAAVLPVEIDRSRVKRELLELERLALLRAEPDGVRWSFHHAILHEVTYGLMLFAQRRALHRAVGEWYERAHDGDLAPYYGLLAHHFARAEIPAKEVEYLEKGGDHALRDGAFPEAAVRLSRALAVDARAKVADDVRRARWQWGLGRAFYRMASLPESRAHAEAAVGVFDRAVPGKGASLAGAIARELGAQIAHRALPARLWSGRAPEEARGRLRAAVSSYLNLSEVYYLAGEQGPSIYAALRQINVAERVGPSTELVEAYGVVCIIAGLLGLHKLAETYRRRALEVADLFPTSPQVRAITLHQVSLYHAGCAEFDRVLADEGEAIAVYKRIGDKGRLRDALGLLGTTEYLGSRHESARALLEELLATRVGDEKLVQEIWGSGWLGAIALREGRVEEAVTRLEASHALLDKNTVGLMEISLTGLLAVARHRLGDVARARAGLERTAELIAKTRGMPSGHISLDGYVSVAELAHALGDDARAEKAARWLGTFARFFKVGVPAAHYWAGRALARRGKTEKARARFLAAEDAASKLGMRWELAQARAALRREGGS